MTAVFFPSSFLFSKLHKKSWNPSITEVFATVVFLHFVICLQVNNGEEQLFS